MDRQHNNRRSGRSVVAYVLAFLFVFALVVFYQITSNVSYRTISPTSVSNKYVASFQEEHFEPTETNRLARAKRCLGRCVRGAPTHCNDLEASARRECFLKCRRECSLPKLSGASVLLDAAQVSSVDVAPAKKPGVDPAPVTPAIAVEYSSKGGVGTSTPAASKTALRSEPSRATNPSATPSEESGKYSKSQERDYELSFFVDSFGDKKPLFVLLLQTLATIFEQSKIDYMLFGGTVLAHCRHAGTLVPFDDDVDLLFAERDLALLKRTIDKWNKDTNAKDTKLGRLQYISDLDGAGGLRGGKVYKIFWENTPFAGWTKWKYPYLDLWTYVLKFYDSIQPKRYTYAQNRKCKGSFHYEGTERFDCLAEEGTGKEWCYVDDDPTSMSSFQEWAYCKPLDHSHTAPDPAGPLPTKSPWNIRWPGAQVLVKQGTTFKGYVYPHEYLFPTQIVEFEGVKLRAPKEMAGYLDWEYGESWRKTCKVGDWDHVNERKKRRADGTEGLPMGVKNTADCQELAGRNPTWKFSLGEATEKRCPKVHVSAPSVVKVLTLQDENKPHPNQPFICNPTADVALRKTVRDLLHSFHKFAMATNLSYWITYGTALGQEVWKGAIPYDEDVDVSVRHRDGEAFYKLSLDKARLKSQFGANMIIHPDYKKAHWRDRKYYRGQGINFVAPLGRYSTLDNPHMHLDIWSEPEHADLPDIVPENSIALQHESYNYISRPLNWVYPLQTCDFDGVQVYCQHQQALMLRFEYGADFRTPHKICHNNEWVSSSKCFGNKCGEHPKHKGKDWCWIDRGPIKNHNDPDAKKFKYCSVDVEKRLAELDKLKSKKREATCYGGPSVCGTHQKHLGKDWCYKAANKLKWIYCTPQEKSKKREITCYGGPSVCGTHQKHLGKDWCYKDANKLEWIYCTPQKNLKAATDDLSTGFLPQYVKVCEKGAECEPRWQTRYPNNPAGDAFAWKSQTKWQALMHKTFLVAKEILDELKVPFHLDSGTALGAIRQGNFMPHDKDVDVGVFQWELDLASLPSINKAFSARGFELLDVWSYKRPVKDKEFAEVPTEVSFKHTKYGVKLDIIIHGLQPRADFTVVGGESNVLLKSTKSKFFAVTYGFGPPCKKRFGTDVCGYWYLPFRPQKLKFLGMDVRVPPREYFIAQYGTSFAQPKDFTYQQGLVKGYDNFCKIKLIRPYKFSLQLGDGEEKSLYIESNAIASTWSDQLREIRYDHFSKQYGIEAVKQFDMLSGQHV